MHYILILALSTLTPYAAVHAASVAKPTDLKSLLAIFSGIIGILVPLIFALIFLTIAWGVIKAWIMGDASAENIDSGKKIALVGVIALTIMISIWGILALLRKSFFGL